MKVIFSGDICFVDKCETLTIAKEIQTLFDSADYSFCCFEAPYISTTGVVKFEKAGSCLKQHESVSSILPLFTHASLANNHIMDYGSIGCYDTIKYLEAKGIVVGGAGKCYEDAYAPIIIEKDGISLAVLCLAEAQFGCCKSHNENRCGYAWILNPLIGKTIQDLKGKYNYVICFAHAGLEMCDIPLPEWRDCYRGLIDYGCDIVIASHPHIIQGKEFYKGKNIYYSLGNFFFNKLLGKDERWNQSLNVIVSINDRGIQCEDFFTKFANNSISTTNIDVEKRYNELSSILKLEYNDEYFRKVNDEVTTAWHNYYENYFSYPIKSDKIQSGIISRLFNRFYKTNIAKYYRPSVGTTMLFHNINVDTHRFAITRAISIMNNTY